MAKPVRIKSGDIYKAFVKLLNDHFPKINVMNVVKDYPRPAFFPKLEVTEVSRTSARHIDTHNIMRLYYFPTEVDNHMVELANMQDELTMILWGIEDGLIEINGVNIEFYDVSFYRVEDVLHCYIELNIGHEIISGDDEDAPNMEVLYPQFEHDEYRFARFGNKSNLGYAIPKSLPLYPKFAASPNIMVTDYKKDITQKEE